MCSFIRMVYWNKYAIKCMMNRLLVYRRDRNCATSAIQNFIQNEYFTARLHARWQAHGSTPLNRSFCLNECVCVCVCARYGCVSAWEAHNDLIKSVVMSPRLSQRSELICYSSFRKCYLKIWYTYNVVYEWRIWVSCCSSSTLWLY